MLSLRPVNCARKLRRSWSLVQAGKLSCEHCHLALEREQ